MPINETPTVLLPPPDGLSPMLGPLLQTPEHMLRTEGPRAACHHCDYLSSGFQNAVDNGLDVHTVTNGKDVVVATADVAAAARWLADCAHVLHMCQH